MNRFKNKFAPEKSEKNIQNIILIVISNIVGIISGILFGFLVPKMISVENYGLYKIFMLYAGYVGVLHFGFLDGIYLVYGGYKLCELDKYKFRIYFKFLFIFEFCLSIFLFIFGIFLYHTSYGVIVMLVSIYMIVKNLTDYFQYISQATSRFKEFSRRNIIRSSMMIIIVGSLYFLHRSGICNEFNYLLFIYINIIVYLILLIWYMFTYRDYSFGKSDSIKSERESIKYLFRLGLPLFIANFVGALIFNIDRQFVSILFSNTTYAYYSFAYSMLSIVVACVSAISIVIYPRLKKSKFSKLKEKFPILNSWLNMFLVLCLVLYFVFVPVVNAFLPKYVSSLIYLRILLPSIILYSNNSIICHNYFKSFGVEKKYFWITIIILGISIFLNIVGYFIYPDPISFSIATAVTMLIWYLIVQLFLIKKMKAKYLKNNLYIFSAILFYYLIVFFIGNNVFGLSIFLGLYLIVTILFYRNEILRLFCKLKKIK